MLAPGSKLATISYYTISQIPGSPGMWASIHIQDLYLGFKKNIALLVLTGDTLPAGLALEELPDYT